jgi:adenine deaminase
VIEGSRSRRSRFVQPDPDLRAALRAAPKVELHLHLDGAMAIPWLLERVRRRDAGVTTPEALRARLAFRTFGDFIERWVWKCGFLDRYEDFESLAESVLTDLAAQGVVHVEPSISPGDYEKAHGLEATGVVEAVLRGMERATRAHGITCGLVVDLIRNHGPATAARRLEEITPYRDQGVVAVGLGGSEVEYPPGPFAEVYAEAGRRGFHRTAHAGEVAGASSVQEALDTLGVERIDHGIRAVEDAALVARLVREAVPLAVCPTSNVRTGAVSDYGAHPLRRLYDTGVRVTVNSDDPTFFGVSVLDELELCLTTLGFAPRELAVLAEHAAGAAFLEGAARERLQARVRSGWTALAGAARSSIGSRTAT